LGGARPNPATPPPSLGFWRRTAPHSGGSILLPPGPALRLRRRLCFIACPLSAVASHRCRPSSSLPPSRVHMSSNKLYFFSSPVHPTGGRSRRVRECRDPPLQGADVPATPCLPPLPPLPPPHRIPLRRWASGACSRFVGLSPPIRKRCSEPPLPRGPYPYDGPPRAHTPYAIILIVIAAFAVASEDPSFHTQCTLRSQWGTGRTVRTPPPAVAPLRPYCSHGAPPPLRPRRSPGTRGLDRPRPPRPGESPSARRRRRHRRPFAP